MITNRLVCDSIQSAHKQPSNQFFKSPELVQKFGRPIAAERRPLIESPHSATHPGLELGKMIKQIKRAPHVFNINVSQSDELSERGQFISQIHTTRQRRSDLLTVQSTHFLFIKIKTRSQHRWRCPFHFIKKNKNWNRIRPPLYSNEDAEASSAQFA